MKEVPINSAPLNNNEENGVTAPKKQETLKTLHKLADDYAELISVREKGIWFYFPEGVPQPQLFSKADKHPFCEDDCQKIIGGKYAVSVDKAVDSKSDCINLVYEKLKKEEIAPPVKKKFTKPIEPAKTARIALFDREYKRAMERYKSELEIYEEAVKSAQTAYDNAMRDYELRVKTVDEEYNKQCDELHKKILSTIEEYIVSCKEYFKRKKQAEEEYEKKQAVLKKSYEAIAKKIQSYPDIVPTKLLKVPEFENTFAYGLQKVESEIRAYIDILESGRADTIKEAINCYVLDKQAEEQKRILEEQAREQRQLMEEQAAQHTCAVTLCPTCGRHCHGMSNYCPTGSGGCYNYYD